MKLQASVRYQLRDGLKGTAIFYAIVTVIYTVFVVLLRLLTGFNGILGSSDGAVTIFLFVLGLNSFREFFWMHLQNGATRKTYFAGRLATSGLLALVACCAELLLTGFLYLVRLVVPAMRHPDLPAIYVNNGETGGSQFLRMYHMEGAAGYAMEFLYNLAFFFFLTLVGLFIALVFYRLNKVGRVLVGAGVPVLFFFALPMLDSLVFGSAVGNFLDGFFDAVWGISTGQPLLGVLAYLVCGAIVAGLVWLLLRRAEQDKG